MKDIDEDAELKLWGQAEGEMEIGKYEILLLVFFFFFFLELKSHPYIFLLALTYDMTLPTDSPLNRKRKNNT